MLWPDGPPSSALHSPTSKCEMMCLQPQAVGCFLEEPPSPLHVYPPIPLRLELEEAQN